MNIYKKSDIPAHLQKYFEPAEIGLEQTPEEYISAMVEVFRCVRDVLADDGTLFLNLGDSYFSSGPRQTGRNDATRDTPGGRGGSFRGGVRCAIPYDSAMRGSEANNQGMGVLDSAYPYCTSASLKPKDLIGIPWRVAFALQADGWYLRQDIIWHKPNPMPESVTDRCTKSHEYIFLLSKSERYFYDHEAVKEPASPASIARWDQDIEGQIGSDRVPGKTNGNMKAVGGKGGKNAFRGQGHQRDSDTGPANREGRDMQDVGASETRNKRSVWTVATVPYKGAHFATFPPALIEPCILAGSRPGDVVLDPFFGSGTTGMVAQNLGRRWLGCELNPAYGPLQDERLQQMGLCLEHA